MRMFFYVSLFAVVMALTGAGDVYAARYAQCDPCGLCKDTTRSLTNQTIYVMPGSWESCFTCLYPTPASVGLSQVCDEDESGRDVVFLNVQGDVIPAPNYCDTLLMAPLPSTAPGVNAPTLAPQSGRMFTDLGCISVDTTTGTFSNPNASVDVMRILLTLVMSITGAVGTALIMAAALQLMTSRGDPEKIREGKKRLTNVVLGVLFAIFALFIFRFFAAEVLRIPGFR